MVKIFLKLKKKKLKTDTAKILMKIDSSWNFEYGRRAFLKRIHFLLQSQLILHGIS